MPDDQPQASVHPAKTVYHEAAERIDKRSREQRLFDRTGMTPDEIVDRIVGEANKWQTKTTTIEPAFQPSYNPTNIEGICSPHLFSRHRGELICRKCGWKPELMPDDQTDELIEQLLERVADLEIAVCRLSGQFYAAVQGDEWRRLDGLVDEAKRNVRDRALSQMKHEMECQTQNAEKSKPLSGDRS